jgi:hypothetical protein
VSVTVVSCLFNPWRGYQRFLPGWASAIAALERSPDHIIIAGDSEPATLRLACSWRYPQAYYLQRAIEVAATEWVWIVDIDDTALPHALNGIDDVDADVWTMGYVRSDGEVYTVPELTATEVYDSPRNVIPAGSAIRTEAFHESGGFLDIAFQDWALWRRLAEHGATFATTGRVDYRYNRHPATRGALELTADRRHEHLAEMHAAEETLAAR